MNYSSIFSLFFFLFLSFQITAQNQSAAKSNGWQPVLNSNDGTNEFQGVVASYSMASCNGGATILLKLENKNSYALRARWKNLIQTNGGADLFATGVPSFQMLPPSSEVKGECGGINDALILKLSDMGVKASDFKTFIAAEFEVIK